MNFADMLDIAMYAKCELKIKTMQRGTIIGTPEATDEFDSDSERFGYYIAIGEHEVDTVFLDEITEITVIDSNMPALVLETHKLSGA